MVAYLVSKWMPAQSPSDYDSVNCNRNFASWLSECIANFCSSPSEYKKVFVFFGNDGRWEALCDSHKKGRNAGASRPAELARGVSYEKVFWSQRPRALTWARMIDFIPNARTIFA